MKTYFFIQRQHHYRDGHVVGHVCGVVMAKNESEAEQKAMALAWNDNSSSLEVHEVDSKCGFAYAISAVKQEGRY